jgi:hypothetical protein
VYKSIFPITSSLMHPVTLLDQPTQKIVDRARRMGV